ncbi:MAG: metalloregulator ArsR/SmtB family transcription factor [Phenylobacterium sp.]
MPDPDLSPLLAFFKAMANESRLRIVGLLAQRERTVQELADVLELKEPTVSHHLAVLKELGLVTVRPEGVMRWHALKPGALAQMNRRLFEQDAAAMAPETSWDDRVLANFVDSGGRLKAIPASRRKRAVVLKWLVEPFVEGRLYPEAEVNETIQRRHWDSATLRRELIGHRMMAREAGVYWRLPESEWRAFDDREALAPT